MYACRRKGGRISWACLATHAWILFRAIAQHIFCRITTIPPSAFLCSILGFSVIYAAELKIRCSVLFLSEHRRVQSSCFR